jgi:peroxiredoxin
MTITPGDSLPDIILKTYNGTALEDVPLRRLCATGITVLFAVPGAFTPACSARHLPGFVENAAALRHKGVDRIACVAVNDAFVMHAWAEANGVGHGILMLGDGNAEWARAAGLNADATPWGMGVRSQRYAMIIKDGVVQQLFVDEAGAFDVSAAQNVLRHL